VNTGIVINVVSVFWLGSEIALARLKHSRPADARYDNSSLRILWMVIIPSVTAGVFLRFQPTGNFGGGSHLFQIAGILFIICGLVLRWVAILSLKRQFTVDVAITKDHRIVKTGVYKFVRHPAYAGSLLSFLGLGLFFANYLSLCVIFLPICSAFLYRILIEEKTLLDAFGDEYRGYCRSTNRLIPGIY
jgi:protein-S-isoprenylcysteine O-methyltransferase Ste14